MMSKTNPNLNQGCDGFLKINCRKCNQFARFKITCFTRTSVKVQTPSQIVKAKFYSLLPHWLPSGLNKRKILWSFNKCICGIINIPLKLFTNIILWMAAINLMWTPCVFFFSAITTLRQVFKARCPKGKSP